MMESMESNVNIKSLYDKIKEDKEQDLFKIDIELVNNEFFMFIIKSLSFLRLIEYKDKLLTFKPDYKENMENILKNK